MSLLKTAARTAVASSVHGRVQRRQQARWAAAHHDPAPAASSPVPAAAGPAPAAAPQDVDVMLAQLERLGRLHASGVLTDAEFTAQKARLLS
ncbi:SHOCT domain-containing protein (plasmid) [Rhodococcus aetherivorans]|uniref:SHOCT domain-containing protein n=1 Tax=Rhodococcus aetherivorans TaxID=191292 RepID=UPI00294A0E59|nr:SHOCT domain-containing protein [Rhodococcus aetherivorans]MDV6296537.1 SHOCT domain-containing protein [Rhodococcus aetherivorans]